MVSTTNPHYITQNATGTSLTQPVDTVDYPHSGLIKALNQMAAGNVVVKTGADFDINQTGSSPANLVVAAGKILRNGEYASVATKTFADSALTTTYAKGYHLLVVADGREGGETINVLYLRTPTANERVPEFKLGDTIVAMIEYSSGTSAGSRLIQYFTTNKEFNSVSIAYANSNVYTPTASIIGAAGGTTLTNTVGDLTIQNTDTNDQIIMKLGTASSATAFEVQDSAAQVQFKVQGDGAVSIEGDLTVSGGDITYGNGQNATAGITATAHNVAGKPLTISAGSTTAGTTDNIAAGSLFLNGGQGKGSGVGGNIIFQTANAAGSGSSLNALATALTLSDDLSATFTGGITSTTVSNTLGATSFNDANITNVGDIALDSISSDASLVTINAPSEIANGSSGGATALLIDNDDTDEIALHIEAANIDADVIQVDANALTTAKVIDISATALTDGMLINTASTSTVTDGGTSTLVSTAMTNDGVGSQTAKGILLDYNKSGITASGKTANVTGMQIDMDDSVVNVGTVTMTGLDIDVDFAQDDGTVKTIGLDVAVASSGDGGDTNYAALFSGGNVGIGTNAPKTQLDVRGPAGTGAASGGALTLSTAELTVVDGDYLGIINFQAPLETGADAILVGASIHAEADVTFDATNNATELVFSTASTSAAIERMRIDQAGTVIAAGDIEVATTIKTSTLFQNGAEKITSGAAAGPQYALTKGIIVIDAPSVSGPTGGPITLNPPEATDDNVGKQIKIIATAIGSSPAAIALDWSMGSQVLVDTTYATIGGTGSPYSLAAGKVYDLLCVALNHWMLILLN